jgi:hypothetical protein
MRITDVPVAIEGAHDTCAFIAAWHTASEAMETGMANNPAMTRADVIAYVDAVIAVYCTRGRRPGQETRAMTARVAVPVAVHTPGGYHFSNGRGTTK